MHAGRTARLVRTSEVRRSGLTRSRHRDEFQQLRQLLGAAADRARLRAKLSGHPRPSDPVRDSRTARRGAADGCARSDRDARESLGRSRPAKFLIPLVLPLLMTSPDETYGLLIHCDMLRVLPD